MPRVALYGGFFQPARRRANSASVTLRLIVFASASMVIVSPVRARAMLPPSIASVVTWPMMNPWLPPLKRPSVIYATSLRRPYPANALVRVSIPGVGRRPMPS